MGHDTRFGKNKARYLVRYLPLTAKLLLGWKLKAVSVKPETLSFQLAEIFIEDKCREESVYLSPSVSEKIDNRHKYVHSNILFYFKTSSNLIQFSGDDAKSDFCLTFLQLIFDPNNWGYLSFSAAEKRQSKAVIIR